MSWTTVSSVSTTYSTEFSDSENGYVDEGYVFNGYVDGSLVWSVVAAVSSAWA